MRGAGLISHRLRQMVYRMSLSDQIIKNFAQYSHFKLPLLQEKSLCVYVPDFYPADQLHQLEQEISWRQDTFKIFGKTNLLPRYTAYYGDEGASYAYSGIVNQPQVWTAALTEIRRHLMTALGESFNAVLVNRYADGSQHMGYHADDESELGPAPMIASLSFGATRRFLIRSRDGRERFGLDLEDRSLTIMAGSFQKDYVHALAKTKRDVGLRINLTFRLIA